MNIPDGVTILNTTEILQKNPTASTIAFIAWIISTIIIIIFMQIVFRYNKTIDILTSCITGTILLIAIISTIISKTNEVPSGLNQYEATIDDTASFNAVYDRYEIVKQDGEIYTLKDKSPE